MTETFENFEKSGYVKSDALVGYATRNQAEGIHTYKEGQFAEFVPLQDGKLFPMFDGVSAILLTCNGFARKEVETVDGEFYTRWVILRNCTLSVKLRERQEREWKTIKYTKNIYDVKEVTKE